jgi:hypothetical protein
MALPSHTQKHINHTNRKEHEQSCSGQDDVAYGLIANNSGFKDLGG